MGTYKKMRKNKNISNRNKKGGFFSTNKVAPSQECNLNNLPVLTKMPNVYDETGELKPLDQRMNDLNEVTKNLQNNYLKCCPKNMMGSKNTSPYCRQLDTSYKSIEQHRRDISGYYGDETNVSEIKKVMEAPVTNTLPVVNSTGTKSKFKFWGGKKTRKRNKKRHYKKK
jgi:hypothetical protein